MYPLTRWSYEDLCIRLSTMENNNLHAESVVVVNQLLEQVIKRYLAKEINTQRQYWDKNQRKWIQLLSISARDAAIREASEPSNWKGLWRKLYHEKRGLPTLDDAFNRVVNPNAWSALVNKGKIQIPPNDPIANPPLKFGFRQCRHMLVHGVTSPPLREIEVLAAWGTNAIKKVLHPETGWPSLLHWNAQNRLPAFRVDKRTVAFDLVLYTNVNVVI